MKLDDDNCDINKMGFFRLIALKQLPSLTLLM